MKALLIEGFTDACRGLGAAVKLFWPAALAYLSMIIVGAVFGVFALADDLLGTLILVSIGFAATVYAFFALCQGAIGWHRRILLNEAAGWISPVPRLRSLKYALAVFVFGLLFLIGHMIISYYTLPYLHSVFTSELRDFDLTNAPVEQLENWRKAVWPIQVATFASALILVGIILWFGRSWILIFPHISIRPLHPTFEQIRRNLSDPVGLVGALLAVYFLPFFIGVIYYAVTPMSVQLIPAVRIPYFLLSVVLSLFCFLCGLSMLSFAYRQGEAKLLFEKA